MLNDFLDDIENDDEAQPADKTTGWWVRAMDYLRGSRSALRHAKLMRVSAHDFLVCLDNQIQSIVGGGLAKYLDTSWGALTPEQSKYKIQAHLLQRPRVDQYMRVFSG